MDNQKPILALETSEKICGVCLYFSDDKYFESKINLKNSHSEKIFSSINYVLKSADINIKDVEEIAVSTGPGSFTGLRIGMSAAKGLALGSNIPIVPVPTFEAIALQVKKYFKINSEIIIAERVNSDEAYFAKINIDKEKIDFIIPLQVKKIDKLNEIIGKEPIITNISLEEKIINNNFIINLGAPDPFYIAQWSKYFGTSVKTTEYDFLEPNYLKNFLIKK
ncbi:MAG: tRNA (adenosine(37)-N6)-threonylcarbamoyltransferase complex dimerization subunit type 1 TsaB [Bacteroidetes bacterium]|nr:tRNA (adenosine(37)-N6)-threonylcarbamoyltransferase complex dimerization subunit type 1 TsaB [Bacteroidota bacterium]